MINILKNSLLTYYCIFCITNYCKCKQKKEMRLLQKTIMYTVSSLKSPHLNPYKHFCQRKNRCSCIAISHQAGSFALFHSSLGQEPLNCFLSCFFFFSLISLLARTHTPTLFLSLFFCRFCSGSYHGCLLPVRHADACQ